MGPRRNIVTCCDGTGNETGENSSNVLKLYRCLRRTEKTQPPPDPLHKLRQDLNATRSSRPLRYSNIYDTK
jgi:hypothetical protein